MDRRFMMVALFRSAPIPALLVVTILLVAACHTADPAPAPSHETITDSEIAASVGLKWHEVQLPGWESIKVSVSGGIVTLEGSLASSDDVNQAVELVRSTDGVKDVQSNLTVQSGLRDD
jgi:osmotically-inducible protein OsmY